MAAYPTDKGSPGTWGAECRAYHAVSTDLATGKINDGALQVSSAAPTVDAALANKKYVDDTVTSRAFGEYTIQDDDSITMLKDHAYLANQDGFITSYFISPAGVANLKGYIGTTTDPAGAGDLIAPSEGTVGEDTSITFPVASGKYFEITSSQVPVIRWHPVGVLIKPTDQD